MMTLTEIRQLLTRKRLKVTPQRAVIVDFMMQTDCHPTAEEIYEAVKDALPGLSKGTLYNVLNTLVDANILTTIALEPGVVRYDANVSNHHHFIDLMTGEVHDIPWDTVENLFQALGKDYSVANYQVSFYGTKNKSGKATAHPQTS